MEPEQDLSLKSATADVQELPPTVTQPHPDPKSSHETLTKSSVAEVRTSSGRVMSRPIRVREDT